MKKVLFVGPDTTNSERYKGGIHNIIKPLKDGYIHTFFDNGIDISFFNTERIPRSATSEGKITTNNLKNTFKIFKDTFYELGNIRYDILLYATSTGLPLLKDLLIARQLKRRYDVRIIMQIHSADIDMILFKNFFLKQFVFYMLVKTCDGCVFLSDKLMQTFVVKGFAKEKSYLLYNYHKLDLCDGPVKTKISRDNKTGKTRLLFMGGFNRHKGLLDLFTALESIDDNLYSLDLCGGYNSDDKELKNVLEKFCSGNKRSIVNHGYVSGKKKNNIFINSDIFVLPSYSEGLPVVLLEAMAAGCAIITTDVGAITEVVKDNENGIIISPGHVIALKEAILRLINDKELLQTLQKTNFNESRRYDIENYINGLSNIFNSVGA